MTTNFGENVKKLRTQKNITQTQLAKILSVGRSTIAGYETKGKQPDYDKLKKLAEFFDVSIDYLLGYSKDSCLTKENSISYKEQMVYVDKELKELINKLEYKNNKLIYKDIELPEASRIALKNSLHNIIEMISALNQLNK